AGLLREWLGSARLSAGQERSLAGALLAFSGEESIQRLVAEALANARTTLATRLLLLRVLARCRLEPLPKSWLEALGLAIEQEDLSIRSEAVATVKARSLSQFDSQLTNLSRQE